MHEWTCGKRSGQPLRFWSRAFGWWPTPVRRLATAALAQRCIIGTARAGAERPLQWHPCLIWLENHRNVVGQTKSKTLPTKTCCGIFSDTGNGNSSLIDNWMIFPYIHPFSRMRSKGSRFTLGVWGLRVCSLDVAFTVATVRNRSQPFARSPYGRAYGKFCRGGHFWRFQMSRSFVSRGRRGTSWHSDVFCNVSKVVLCGTRNTFATFSEDVLHFSWQVQHFGRVHRHFSWQAQHFRRVVLRVFCQSHWQGCVKWRQGANSVAGVAFCAMCWKLTEASHETSILRLQIFRF